MSERTSAEARAFGELAMLHGQEVANHLITRHLLLDAQQQMVLLREEVSRLSSLVKPDQKDDVLAHPDPT